MSTPKSITSSFTEPEELLPDGLFHPAAAREPAGRAAGLGVGRAAEQSAQRDEVRAAVHAAESAAEGSVSEATEDPWTMWLLSLPESANLDIYEAKKGGGYKGGRLERLPVSAARTLGFEIWSAAERWLAERVRPGDLYVAPKTPAGDRLPGVPSRLVHVRPLAGASAASPARIEAGREIDEGERASAVRRDVAESEERASRFRLMEMEKKAEIDAAREEREDIRRRDDRDRDHAAAIELRRMELEASERDRQRQAVDTQQKLLLDLALGRMQTPAPAPVGSQFDPMKFMDTMVAAQMASMGKIQEMAMASHLKIMEAATVPQKQEPWVDVALALGEPLMKGLSYKLGNFGRASHPVSSPALLANPQVTYAAPPATEARAEAEPVAASAPRHPVSAEQRRAEFQQRQRTMAVGITLEHLMAIHAGVMADDEAATDTFLELCPVDIQQLIEGGDAVGIMEAVGPVVQTVPDFSAWFGRDGVNDWVMGYLERARTVLLTTNQPEENLGAG